MTKPCLVFTLLAATMLLASPSTGQVRIHDPHFSLTAMLGAGWSGDPTWTFSTCDCAPRKPGIALSIGVEYGPLVEIDGAQLVTSADVSFAQESAHQSFETGSIEGGVQRMPIMVWAKIISDRNLSPFLRLGAGIAKTDFREDSRARRGPTIRFHEWHFVWGLGGGLNYQLDSTIGLELFIEDWISETQLVGLNSFGEEDGIFGRNGTYAFGARAIINL